MENGKTFVMNEYIKKNLLGFQTYGVKIGIRAANAMLIEKIFPLLTKIFPNGFESVRSEEIEYEFRIRQKRNGDFELLRDGKKVFSLTLEKVFLEILESHLRTTVARYTSEKVFLHAGVVAWKGIGIVFPADSFSGKSTLVAEMVKRGALYYSDEYAVLDENGAVHPFAKMLSLRGIIDDYEQLECSVESLGGTAAQVSVSVKVILMTRFEKNTKLDANSEPEILSLGQSVMELLPHTFSLRSNPKFTLEVLNKTLSRAIIIRIVRGEVRDFAEWLLHYLESRLVKLTV